MCQKAFHNIDVCLEHQTYLGFAHNGGYFAFTVLPFGLTLCVFTKCMRELVKHWRKNEVQIVMFLDDGLGTNYDKQKKMCPRDSDFVKNALTSSGFLISDE